MSETRLRVLLIDDSEIVLEAQTAVLSAAGFDVRAVGSLQRFINALLDWKPHVVVTDLYMPEMSGAELCAWIRRQLPTLRIPIVVCSAAPDEELAEIVKTVGADAAIPKRLGLDGLTDHLRELTDSIVF